LLIADEPTTALDVTIQAQVLDLLRKAQKETARSTVLITHDLGVIAELADRVVVMYAGQVVEHADVRTIFDAPRHPYTLGLMRSRPRLDEPTTALKPIPGSPPDPLHRVGGCPFRPRCEHSAGRELCVTERPALRTMGSGHTSACHFAEELASEPKVVR
jgi:oligopeptide/dipeptide ABC transporter ATP-binding protein